MPVFQCIKGPTVVTFNYERVTFARGQLVKTGHPTIKNHPHFSDVSKNPEAVRRAPLIHQIRPLPPDPIIMSHDEVVGEIRSYGVVPDPYESTSTLAFKLRLIRKMARRTFITVLDDYGHPLWLEQFQLLKNSNPEKNKAKEQTQEALAPPEVVKKEGGSVALIEKPDQYEQGQETDLSGLLFAPSLDNEIPVDKQKPEDYINFDPGEHKYTANMIEVTDRNIASRFGEEKNGPPRLAERYEYLTEISPLILEDVKEHEIEEELKWTKIPLIVFECYLRYKDIYDDVHNNRRRWNIIDKVRKFYDEDSEKVTREINILIKRYEELDDLEPFYKKCTDNQIRYRTTMLNRYGIKIKYPKLTGKVEIMSYSKKVFTIVKLGKLPTDTLEEMDAFLIKAGYQSLVEDPKDSSQDN